MYFLKIYLSSTTYLCYDDINLSGHLRSFLCYNILIMKNINFGWQMGREIFYLLTFSNLLNFFDNLQNDYRLIMWADDQMQYFSKFEFFMQIQSFSPKTFVKLCFLGWNSRLFRKFDLSKFGVGFQSLNPVQNSEMVINFWKWRS